MNLTADNTAIVLDSTADFPDAAERFPNWRVVPLYVNFGDESFRDGVDLDRDAVLRTPAHSPTLPTTSQPTPADFLACYEELAAYERILSLHIAAKLSGTFQSAGTAAAELGDDRVRTIDSRDGVGRDRDARARDPATARARHDRRGDRRARRPLPRAARAALHRRHARVPRARRPHRPRAPRSPGQLLNVKPILAIHDGEVVPVKRVRGNRKALQEFVDALDVADA